MPEREQAGEAEEQVVRERDPREEQAEREQAERAGAVERAGEDDRDVQRQLRDDREHREQRQRDHERGNAPRHQCATFGREPAGPHEQDDREQQHDREVAEAGRRVVVRVLLHQADDDRGDRGAADRAEAADHDDDEGEDQERGAAARIDGTVIDAGEDARERGGHPADREDEREGLADVDPERGHHRPVLDAGADDQAVARVPQERREPEEDEHGGRDLEEAVVRDVRAEDRRRVDQPVGNRELARVEAPDRLDERTEDERQPDGDEHLLDRALVERADQHELDERREHAADGETDDRADEQLRSLTALDLGRRPPGRIGADREEGAVGEVEHAHQAVDQREPGGDQEVHRAEPQARDRQQDEGAHQ